MVISQYLTLSKIEHRGVTRIKITFDHNRNLIQKVKSIGARWSQTKRCWHLPYQKHSFEQLELTFGKELLVFPKKENTLLVDRPLAKVLYASYQLEGETKYKIIGEKVILKKLDQQWLKVYVPYDKRGWAEVLKNINGRKWNVEKVCWEIPNVKDSYRQLKKLIGMENLQFDFVIEKDIPENYDVPLPTFPKRKTAKVKYFDLLNENQKAAINQTEKQIILKRLSYSTLKSYKNSLIAIFYFHKNILPEELTNEDIQAYLLHQIKFKKISESTQNSIINGIKAYWEKVLKRPREKIEVPRPKKPKHLPNVFSQEEVVRLIESPENLKHKLMLLLIYSAGLRLGEVVNIRVRDINFDRRVIFIKDGKGKKDRFVTLAEEVIPHLHSYKQQYRPVYWLLEGNTGGQYSKRSVQNVFRKAMEESKVFAYGTVHTLRHSYATHCVENGFDVALLKEALGHGSIKTTEKYLHISSKALRTLTSPLDIFKGYSKKQS
jgi:integrase/recombinase XerD